MSDPAEELAYGPQPPEDWFDWDHFVATFDDEADWKSPNPRGCR